MAADKEHLAYFTGSRWVGTVTVALMIAVLSLWLAASLRETQERTEKLVVELAVRQMRMALQIAVGEAVVQGRAKDVVGWVGSNPTRWLDGQLHGYAGNCLASEELAPGSWCFDALRGELHYRPEQTAHLRLKNGAPVSLLKWRLVAENPTGVDGMVGLHVENLTPYEWFAE